MKSTQIVRVSAEWLESFLLEEFNVCVPEGALVRTTARDGEVELVVEVS